MRERGYTLVELLVVMVLMGLLATLVTKAVTKKATAAQAVLKSDLRNLAVAEEAYFSDHRAYADVVDALEYAGSKGVTFELRGNATGWAARASHDLTPDYTCALYLGDSVEPFEPATEEGKLRCTPGIGGSGCSGG
jgi:prepilin-type N-terminal cleavage/methylation domain-containing protein